LTPLEHKQVQIEATEDVLFEQSGKKRPAKSESGGIDPDGFPAVSAKPARKKKKDSSKSVEATKSKIEGLSYSRLVPGSIVLGRIAQITPRDIALAISNNLTGYVPLTAISDHLNERLQSLLEESEDSNDEKMEDATMDRVDLKKLFRVGQYLRAHVTGNENSGLAKRRIELSINPRLANEGISDTDLSANCAIQASVRSVEDHGLVVDMGLEDSKLTGFISTKELADGSPKDIEEGTVLLCRVMAAPSGERVVKLSTNLGGSSSGKPAVLRTTSSIRSFTPGTLVDMLVMETADFGLRGNIMGLVDVTADAIHSGAPFHNDFAKKYKPGAKTKARILFTVPKDDGRVLGVSLLDHILEFGSQTQQKSLAISTILSEATVVKVQPHLGLFLDLGENGSIGFAHISKISDKKIDSLSEDSGLYRVGSTHRARVIGHNAVDGLFVLSLEQKILDQPFLTVDDVSIGQVVKGTVERIVINERGVGGIVIKLADGVTGLVPEMHMADVKLLHPERKFREGMSVKARVLDANPEARSIRLTLKKTLVNSDVEPWTTYDKIEPGFKSPGTIVSILPKGAVVQFYGSVRGYLPLPEMSEAFIDDPKKHFSTGQVVSVRVLNVDPANEKMTVSCKDPSSISPEQLKSFGELKICSIVKGAVTEISSDSVTVELENSIKATLRLRHLADATEAKCRSLMKKLRVGQTLKELVVIGKSKKRPLATVSQKPELIKAARIGKLCTRLEELKAGVEYAGFVRNIISQGVFVEFAESLVAFLPGSQMPSDMRARPQYGLEIGQTFMAKALSIDPAQQKAILTLRDDQITPSKEHKFMDEQVQNPVDGQSFSHNDFGLGKKTIARVVGVKASQLNVRLADNVQGRIDASEVFEKYEDIKDRKHPLCGFKAKQTIPVRIVGVHDVKSHTFLPISHRRAHTVYELSARHMEAEDGSFVLTIDKLSVGDRVIGIVNNHGDACLWVNLSPSVRGRVNFLDLGQGIHGLKNVLEAHPIGSALDLTVKSVDLTTSRLDLARASKTGGLVDRSDLREGTITTGRVTKVSEHGIAVELNDSRSGNIPLTEIADDFDTVDLSKISRNDIVKVRVVELDQSNKKVCLSTRPSQLRSGAVESGIADRRISSVQELKVNDVLRGFVKNVTDKGLFVSIGPTLDAFVMVSDISDSYIREWKPMFTVRQLVKGKIIQIDHAAGQVKMSLKNSIMGSDYVAPLTFDDMTLRQVVTAKVRKVEDYGVFIVVNNSKNVSGLCHRSEIADGKVDDVKRLYDEGDEVKAIVLKISKEKKRINFGLKASYFADEAQDTDGSDVEPEDGSEGGVRLYDDLDRMNISPTVPVGQQNTGAGAENGSGAHLSENGAPLALKTSGFDWSGGLDNDVVDDQGDETMADTESKRKRKRSAIEVDKTGDLDKFGPKSEADFERLLLSRPNDSPVWIQYMAFQLGLGEVDKARAIADRALKTIDIREEDEKLNIWIAWLNLENTYGADDAAVDDLFSRACEYNDKEDMHERMVSIFIESGKHEVSSATRLERQTANDPQRATDLFQGMTQLKALSAKPAFWLNYATFLMTSAEKPDAARALLSRAKQSLADDAAALRALTARFGALEFQSPRGDRERGRTVFEGLVDLWPKRTELWDTYVALERGPRGSVENARRLFARMAGLKMGKRRARFVFKRWVEFEEGAGSMEDQERVKRLAAEYVKKLRDAGEAEE
jgi:rRNA biogenesis protein RRP5